MSLARLLFRWILGKRLPIVHGALAVERPSGWSSEEIEIRRDEWGIPHIRAANDFDAWFALGFCHGQDRPFQLESILRLGRGTMSEIVGPEALPIDRLARRIGFHRSAQKTLEHPDLAPGIAACVEAYAAGVNEGRTKGLEKRPHEFVLTRSEPSAYVAADAAAILPIMSFLLASNWDAELARMRVLLSDGEEAVRALDPSEYPPEFTVTESNLPAARSALDRLTEDLAALTKYFSIGGASNNWVLAGSKTRSGRPIVANDPHLSPALPSPWYLATIRTPDWAAGGASFVGAPGFSVGHNSHVAWGVTSGFVDNTDLFIEEIGDDGRSVRSPSGFDACEVREEHIRVKGGADVVEAVLETPRGPIVTPELDAGEYALSLRATWLDGLPICGTLGAQRARDAEAFRDTFRQWPTLPLNLVFADASGDIGWQLVGDAPRRKSGWGMMPRPGWLADSGWEDTAVPFEEMPSSRSPECGFIATANNTPRTVGEGAFVGADFLDSYRQDRIQEVLVGRDDWDASATQELQLDVVSIPWRHFREHIFAACDSREDLAPARGLFEDWDGELEVGSVAATVFQCWIASMCQRVAHAKAPNSLEDVLGVGVHPLLPKTLFASRRVGHLLGLVRERPDGWFEQGWLAEMAEALFGVCEDLAGVYGRDVERWAWGRVRGVRFRHAFSQVATFAPIFDRGPYAMGGDANTVAQSAVDPLDPLGPALFIPSLRMVADVGAWDECRFVIPGGQSANPLSRNYDDQLALWLRGETLPLAISEEAVERATRARLVLCRRDERGDDALSET